MITINCSESDRRGRTNVTAVDDEDGVTLHADVIDPRSDRSRNRFSRAAADAWCQKQQSAGAAVPKDAAKGVADGVNRKSIAELPRMAAKHNTLPLPEVDHLAIMSKEERELGEGLLLDPNIFDCIGLDIRALGVTGDERVGLGAYLTGTSRLLKRPLACLVRGASSSGKSFLITRTARLFPAEVKLETHMLTPRALYYMPDDALRNKFVVAGERPRRHDDEAADATKALREMISDGVLRSQTVETVDGRLRTVAYEKQGPNAFIESTSAPRIFSEDANRCIVFHVDESEAQTRAVVRAMAEASADTGPDATGLVIGMHHAAQRMLKRYRVVIPYARLFAARFPTSRVEARRGIGHLLSTIESAALLRQFQKRPSNGVLTADVEDYRVARYVLDQTLGRLCGSVEEPVKRVWHALAKHAVDGSELSGVRPRDGPGCANRTAMAACATSPNGASFSKPRNRGAIGRPSFDGTRRGRISRRGTDAGSCRRPRNWLRLRAGGFRRDKPARDFCRRRH